MAQQPLADRPAQPIRVVAEGLEEVQQLLRRMTTDAYRIAGGVLVAVGPQVFPLFWVEPAAQAAVEQLRQFHHDAAGQPLQNLNMTFVWATTQSADTVGPHLARLTVDVHRPDTTHRAFSVWWDAPLHQTILTWVVRTQQVLLLSRKPHPAELDLAQPMLPPWVGLSFPGELVELRAFLEALPPAPPRPGGPPIT